MKTAETVCNELDSVANRLRGTRSELVDLRFDFGNDCSDINLFVCEIAAVQVVLTNCANRIELLKRLFKSQ